MFITLSNNNSISFNYSNSTFSTVETIFLKNNLILNDGEWHSILLLDNINHLEFYFDNILMLSETNISFLFKRFALDFKSQIIFGKTDKNSSFKVFIYLFF